MPNYHFDLGDSNNGPVGFCAVIQAGSKERALAILQMALPEDGVDVEYRDSNGNKVPELEYIRVYFNPKHVTVKDIDDED